MDQWRDFIRTGWFESWTEQACLNRPVSEVKVDGAGHDVPVASTMVRIRRPQNDGWVDGDNII